MIKVKILFTTTEAIQVFRNAGLKVEMCDFPVWFQDTKHPEGGTEETIPIMAVINPHTQQPEKLEEVFQRYLEAKKAELFLNPENLEIYNLFQR
jgi:hypothetical protein